MHPGCADCGGVLGWAVLGGDVAMELTEKMKETLKDIAYGVRKRGNRFYCIDEPEKHVDIRSMEALVRRGLIGWHGAGGSTHQYFIELTQAGWDLFYEHYGN